MVLLNFCAPALLFVSADRSECVHNRGGTLDWVCKPMVGLSLWSVYMGEGQVFHFGCGGKKCFPCYTLQLSWLLCQLKMQYVYLNSSFFSPLQDENVTQKACRSFLQMTIPKSSNDSIVKKTRIRPWPITEIKVPQETQIRVVNNNKHRHSCHCQSFLHQELKYDLVNFNSEHFATFVQYSYAVFN